MRGRIRINHLAIDDYRIDVLKRRPTRQVRADLQNVVTGNGFIIQLEMTVGESSPREELRTHDEQGGLAKDAARGICDRHGVCS